MPFLCTFVLYYKTTGDFAVAAMLNNATNDPNLISKPEILQVRFLALLIETEQSHPVTTTVKPSAALKKGDTKAL